MHSFLRGEMFKAGVTIASLAAQIGISEKSLRNKLKGETDFTWPEAMVIRSIIDPQMEMEELFKTDNDSSFVFGREVEG